jgi:hypothetical protein
LNLLLLRISEDSIVLNQCFRMARAVLNDSCSMDWLGIVNYLFQLEKLTYLTIFILKSQLITEQLVFSKEKLCWRLWDIQQSWTFSKIKNINLYIEVLVRIVHKMNSNRSCRLVERIILVSSSIFGFLMFVCLHLKNVQKNLIMLNREFERFVSYKR